MAPTIQNFDTKIRSQTAKNTLPKLKLRSWKPSRNSIYQDSAPVNLNYAPKNQDYAPDNLIYAPKKKITLLTT